MSVYETSKIELDRFKKDAQELFELIYTENSPIITPIEQELSFVVQYSGQISLLNNGDIGTATISKNGIRVTESTSKSIMIDVIENDRIDISVRDGEYGIYGNVVLKTGSTAEDIQQSFQSLFKSKLKEVMS